MSLKNLFVFSLVLRLILGSILPLSPDEAYYWIWSHFLQLSYFDHPPLVSWWFWLGHPFEGWQSAVRIPSILLSQFTFGVWLLIAKRELPGIDLRWFFLLLLVNPLTGWGSLVVTPDLPLMLFWGLSLLFYLKALETGALRYYVFLGISLGLGFLAKYPIVLIVPAFLIHLWLNQAWRKVRWGYLVWTVALGFLGCVPVIAWNYFNEWQSFKFQINHGFGGSGGERFSWNWPAEYIGTQVIILTPWLIPFLWKGASQHARSLLSISAFFPWAFFLYSSMKAHVEANWALTSFPAAFALLVPYLKNKKLFYGTVLVWALLGAVIMSHWHTPWVPGARGKLNETHDIREIIPQVKDLQPLFTSTHQLGALLSFELKRLVPKHRGINRYDFFDSLEASVPKEDFYILMMHDHVGQLRYQNIQEIPLPVSRYRLFRVTLE